MSQAIPTASRLHSPGASLLLLLTGLFLAFALVSAGCARDCDSMIERRCRALGAESETCLALRARAAAIPHQSCEAVLNAIEKRPKAR